MYITFVDILIGIGITLRLTCCHGPNLTTSVRWCTKGEEILKSKILRDTKYCVFHYFLPCLHYSLFIIHIYTPTQHDVHGGGEVEHKFIFILQSINFYISRRAITFIDTPIDIKIDIDPY